MNKFKVGDRVRVYSDYADIRNAIIASISGDILRVSTDINNAIWDVHYKQCRKLVKKKKEKLGRELWLSKPKDSTSLLYQVSNYKVTKFNRRKGGNLEIIHVREILE